MRITSVIIMNNRWSIVKHMCTKVEFNYLGAYKRMNVSVRQKNEIDKERLGILAEHISPSEIKLVL
jgi:hypothetical protein